MDVIRTTQLCKAYGNKNAVDHIDLVVPEGAIYGFIGILQGYSVGVADPKSEALKSLEMVSLSKFAQKKAKHLSLGMKQRLGIAIAMLGSPKLLVLDEPINGLDPEGIIDLRNVIERLNQEFGITIFISSHILGELSKIATHYGIIKDGQLIQQVSAEDLAKSRKDYLHIRVPESEKAIVLLREKLNPKGYELHPNGEIHLYGVTDTGAVNQILSSNGLTAQEIYLHEQNLEDYFLDLMGGEKVA